MHSLVPRRKVAAGGVAGSITVVLVWLLRAYAGVEVPADVATAITALLIFIAGYLTPEPSGDVPAEYRIEPVEE